MPPRRIGHHRPNRGRTGATAARATTNVPKMTLIRARREVLNSALQSHVPFWKGRTTLLNGDHWREPAAHGDAVTFDYWATTDPGADFRRGSKASSRTHEPPPKAGLVGFGRGGGYDDILLNPHMPPDEPLAWRVVLGYGKCPRNPHNPDRLRDSAISIDD